MRFANPSAFFLLIPLAALIAARLRWIRSAPLPFPDLSIPKTLPTTWRVLALRWRAVPLYLGIALAIVALARPQKVLKGEEARARGIDIMMTIDTSGSMRALDFDPLDRMAVAKRATKTFIMHRQYDRIGLVVFAGTALLQCPLTLDYAALLDFLSEVEVGIGRSENTAIGTALASASNHLKKSTAKSRVIILVTDGRSNAGEIDPITAAKAAQALGIRIYTIGIGIRGESKIPVDHPMFGRQLVPIQEDLDEPSLQQIARETGGHYFRATSTKEFDQIYSEIDKMERTEIKGPTPLDYEDLYLPWLMVAMVLLSIGFVAEATVLRVFP